LAPLTLQERQNTSISRPSVLANNFCFWGNMKLRIACTAPLLLAATFAQAADKPNYLNAAPKTFCMSGESVAAKIQSCNDNPIFLQAAQKCYGEFKALKKSTAADMSKRFGTQNDAQKANFANNAADNKEAMAAHDYLISLGDTAVKELTEYFDWIEQPEDAMNDEEIRAEPCFMDTAKALNQLVYELMDEVEDMKEARKIEAAHNAISGQHDKQIDGSVNSKIQSTKGTGSATFKGGIPKDRDSDVTGIEESKKRNEKQK
jgi:hypothetical protein